ncbi:DUF2304 domain-containing protein [Actinomycetospora straminea]|uniref:DUF2304 domain-containing protein n=1 Tax=Actinomycetospora straminea TaxID=663607 RepID=A0ABP9EMZ1_9PSEU|nr:DUF2304 domain-containing protein [Actinomycetospora straminea]MDD7933836.1 DUF2304 domain-containing protein [Actinomycetospora straminea]
MARLTIVTIVVAIIAAALVVELLRGRRLRQKYAFLWMVVAGATVVISISPTLLQRASVVLGIAVPSNLLFLASLLILFGVSLQLSIEVGVLEEQARRLAEEVGALRLRLEDVEWRAETEPGVDVGSAHGSETDVNEPHTRLDGIRPL